MNARIFNPGQFQNAQERSAALLALCGRLVEGEFGMISLDGDSYALKDVADLLAGLWQNQPDAYVGEALVNWVETNREALVSANMDYVNSHLADLLNRIRQKKDGTPV